MRAGTRHPRVVGAACRIYGLMTWLYPSAFRRAFGRELLLTFRSRFEDVLDGGGPGDCLAFVAHIMWDTVRTAGTLAASTEARNPVSLLGLSEGDAAQGCVDDAIMSVDLMFAVAGLVLGFLGWYAYFAILPLYVS